MQLKKPNKSLILLLSLLLIGTPTNSQASQTHSSSNPKKLVIPTLALAFLSRQLNNISDDTQCLAMLETLTKFKISPDKLKQEEMKGLNEYVKQETIQLGNQLPSIKDHNKLQTKQNTYQQLTSLQQQLALLHKASFPQTIHRPGELIIPANGKCLYTSIILGYLLPVVNNQKAFDQRLRMIMDKQKLPITNEQLARHYNDLDYLDSNPAFQQIINALLKQIGIKPGTWGGPKEIRLIADKLNLNIQEYTPDPDNPKQLIKGELMRPNTWFNTSQCTIHIIQDTPLQGELVNPDHDFDLQQGQLSSLQGLQNRHHYRLYYTDRLPQPMPKAPTNQNNKSEQPQQKHTDEENPKPTSILPDNAPQPKTSLPDLLKTHYKAQNQIPRLLGDKPQPLESCYIHLAMLTKEEHKVKKEKFLKKQPKPDDDERKEDEPQEEEKSWNKSMDYGLLHKVQKPIKLEDLWKPEENQSQASRHVVVTGEAGTGKSTLSTYMAYQWAKGTLWQDRFNWVLQLPLRKVRDLSDQQSSHNQIATALGIPNFDGKNLQSLLQQKQPGLLILDGYDEVAIEVQKENSPLAQWLQPCFDNKGNLSIILTTRPGPHCPYVKQYQDLRVLGFQQQDIDRYVNTYFPFTQPQNNNQKPVTSKKAKALLQVMQQNPTLKLLSHTPLYLRLLCILAKQQGAHALSQCSTPQLYEQIIAQFLCYNLARHNNKPPTDEEQDLVFKTYGLELAYLGELAFEGMKASQAVLPVDLQKTLLKKLRLSHPRTSATAPEHWTRIASLGLLQGYTCSSPRPKLPTYFPHLTIQEWLAAHYLVTALYDNQHKDHHTSKAIINQDKYAPRYQVMLPFVAGICYQHIRSKIDPQGKGLTAFWWLLNAQPRELSGIHHAMLVARCLEACAADTSSTMLLNLHKPLIQQVAGWLQALLDYPYDAKDVFVDYYENASVLLPRMADVIQAGLQGCPILLRHPIITNKVKPAWPTLNLEGKYNDTTTKRWHTRLAKIKALLKLTLAHPTAKHLSTYLQKALQHDNRDVREAAVGALPDMLGRLEARERKAFIPLMLNAFKDKDSDVRAAAAGVLPDMLGRLEARERKAFIPLMLNAFKDKDSDVRAAAAGALPDMLGRLEAKKRKTFIPLMLNALKDELYSVRKAAVGALPDMLGRLEAKELKAFMLNALKDENEWVRKAAVGALPDMLGRLEAKKRKTFIPLMLNALTDEEWRVRYAAAGALPDMLGRLEAKERKAFMLNALKDKDYHVREAAVGALPDMLGRLEAKERKTFIPLMLNALTDEEWRVRYAAAGALPDMLGRLEAKERKALMLNALKDKDYHVREAAVGALPDMLGRLEAKERKALMLNALKDKLYSVRKAAVGALPDMLGRLEAKELKAFMLNALKDENEWVRKAAVGALPDMLGRLEAKKRKTFIPLMLNAFKDKDSDVRAAAAGALPDMLGRLEAKKRKTFIPLMLNAFKDKDSDVRAAAAGALPDMLGSLEAKERKTFIPLMLNALKDKLYSVRKAAVGALPDMLGRLEAKERKVFIPPMMNALKDEYKNVLGNYPVREAAVGALPDMLGRLEAKERKAFIPPMMNALKDEDRDVREAAAGALPDMLGRLEAKERKAFIPLMLNALTDEEWRVREAAVGALPDMLGRLEAKECKAFMLNALKDKDYHVREAAVGALPDMLGRLEAKERKALMLNALKDKLYSVRKAAVGALPDVLGRLEAKERKAFIPPMMNAFKDKSYAVRKAAAGALQKIADKVWKGALQHQLQTKPIVPKPKPTQKPKPKPKQPSTWDYFSPSGLWSFVSGREKTSKAPVVETPPAPVEDPLKDWAYVLLKGSVLVCFSHDERKQLSSYPLLIKDLKTQASTWGWPQHTYSAKPLRDNFTPNLPQLPAITIHRPLGHTPLHQAAQRGDLDALAKLWQNTYYHAYLNDQHNEDQRTPLLCAIIHKQWQAAKWLINKGAWLDVADKYGQSPLQKIITLRHWHQHKEALPLIKHLLQKRTFFPKDRVDDKVKYVIEQGLDKETKARKPLRQKTYHKHLCKAVTGLLGEDVKGFQEGLLKRRDFYEAASKNIEKQKREHINKEIKYTTGLATSEFLPYRIALLFDVLVNLRQGDFFNKLPENSEGEVYKIADIYEAGLQELQTQLTTFWANKLMEGIFTLRFDLKPEQCTSCYRAWAEGITHCLPKLALPYEVSLALGYAYPDTGEGHCIYVSLTHTSTHYIVRVDNRWINTAPKNAHPLKKLTFHQKEQTYLQPYLVVYFPIDAWDKHQSWLVDYVARAGQLSQAHKPDTVVNHLYQTNQKAPKQGNNKPKWIETWPWRPLQTTADNCFMRSHNVGYRIRLGNKLYKWFRQKSSTSYLLERQFIEDQLATSSPDKGPKLQGGSNQMGNNKQSPEKAFKLDEEETKEDSPQPQPKDTMYISPKKSKFKKSSPKQTTSSKKLPSHQEVMKRFAKKLRVNYDAVYSGIAAEQSLVRYAGVSQTQTSAMFRRDSQTGRTWFKLRLNSYEANLFMDHYQTLHPDAIKKRTTLGNGWVRIVFDTARLYDEIIPNLV